MRRLASWNRDKLTCSTVRTSKIKQVVTSSANFDESDVTKFYSDLFPMFTLHWFNLYKRDQMTFPISEQIRYIVCPIKSASYGKLFIIGFMKRILFIKSSAWCKIQIEIIRYWFCAFMYEVCISNNINRLLRNVDPDRKLRSNIQYSTWKTVSVIFTNSSLYFINSNYCFQVCRQNLICTSYIECQHEDNLMVHRICQCILD